MSSHPIQQLGHTPSHRGTSSQPEALAPPDRVSIVQERTPTHHNTTRKRIFAPLPSVPEEQALPSLFQHAGTIMPVSQLDRDAQRCPCQRIAYRHQHKRSKTLQCTNAGCTTHEIHMGANLYHCRDRSCFHRFCQKCHSLPPCCTK